MTLAIRSTRTQLFAFRSMESGMFGRRPIVLAALPLVLATSRAESQSNTRPAVRMRMDDSALREIPASERPNLQVIRDDSDDARALSAAAPSERGIPILYMVLGTLGIPLIWQSLMEMRRQTHFGGVLIDTRQTPPFITSSRAIPPGSVWVVDAAGATRRYAAHEFSEGLLRQLLGAQ